jgi:hypothetical protein
MAAAAEKKKNVSEEQQTALLSSTSGSSQRFIPPLNMLLRESDLGNILVNLYRVSDTRIVQRPGLVGLPTVHENVSYEADIFVGLKVNRTILQLMLADKEAEEDIYSLGQDINLHVEMNADDEATGEVVLEVRSAAKSKVVSVETAIVENERFLKLCNASEENLEKLENSLSKMGRIINELSKEESLVSVASLDTEDEILSGASKGALRGALVEAGSLEQRRAAKRREELTQTLETLRSRLEKVVFGKGPIRKLLNPNEMEIPDEATALFGSAFQVVVNDVEM